MSEFIDLTVITVRLKKDALDTIQGSFLEGYEKNASKDSYGRDADFYKELGIDPPEDLDTDKSLELKEEDLETIESPARFRPENISFFVSGDKTGSTVYLDLDYKVSVKETVEEIELKINKLSKKSKNVVK